MERLARQPKVSDASDVLSEAFVEPFAPCQESYSELFRRSLAATNEGLASSWSPVRRGFGLTRGYFGAKFVGETIGTRGFIAYGLRVLSGAEGFTGIGAATAVGTSGAGMILAYPAWKVGLHLGTAINVRLVEPLTNPCHRVGA